MDSRILSGLAFCAAAVVMVACGGGGVKSGSPDATSGLGCSVATYAPNYVETLRDSSGLGHFVVFPVTVYFDRGGTWSRAREDAFIEGIQRWLDEFPVSSGPSFQITSDVNADVRVSFAPQSTLGGSTVGLTTPRYFTSSREISYSTVAIATTNPSGSARSLSAIRNTSSHEMGHAVGIFGHSPTYADQMYAFDDGTNQGIVTNRDVNTLLTAYCGIFGRADRSKKQTEGELVAVEIRD